MAVPSPEVSRLQMSVWPLARQHLTCKQGGPVRSLCNVYSFEEQREIEQSFWSLKGKKTTTCEIEFLEQQSDKHVPAPCCGIGKHSEHS